MQNRLIKKLLFIAIVSLIVIIFSYHLLNSKVRPKKIPVIKDLASQEYQKKLGKEIYEYLLANHYLKFDKSKINSEKLFDSYLKRLDGNKIFFIQDDIDEFTKYKDTFLNSLVEGDLEPSFLIFNRYTQRLKEHINFMQEQLKHNLDDIQFDTDKTLLIDRKDENWFATKQEQEQRWLDEFHNNVLSSQLNNTSNAKIVKKLNYRYSNMLKRMALNKSEDVFFNFVNTFTTLYDPHTQYFSPQDAENFNINMSLSLEGIGAALTIEDDYVKVASIVAGGPAEKAGQLKPGDRIVSVGQGKKGALEDIISVRLDDAVKKIRGKKNTAVRLEVIPSDSKNGSSKIYTIIRDTVKLEDQEARSEVIEITQADTKKKYNVGVIAIPTFYMDFKQALSGNKNYKSTTRDVKKLIGKLTKDGIDGLIIDLRKNSGGALQEVNELVGLFVGREPSVQVRYIDAKQNMKVEVYGDTESTIVYDGPLLVMVDRASASASEIFAGAMQDHGRAIIVGSQTFGKGTVQAIQSLTKGQIKYTSAKFYRITGKSTQNKGVMPDIAFPSFINETEIGESTIPNAMPWDEISSVVFTSRNGVQINLDQLQQQHDIRAKQDPYFVYAKSINKYTKKYHDIKELSLNKTTRQKNIKELEDARLEIENELCKARDEPLLKDIKELDKKNSNKKDKTDEYLQEASQILVDYTLLTKSVHNG
jgi:carboxyl-terminal processing protease